MEGGEWGGDLRQEKPLFFSFHFCHPTSKRGSSARVRKGGEGARSGYAF